MMGTPESTLILVADDGPQVRALVREILEGEGFRTVTADDGERALELALERRPALMILDIMMPKMDGYTLLTRLHRHPPPAFGCREAGVRRVVYASSSSVYENQEMLPLHEGLRPAPLSPYAVSKLAGEHYCRVFASLYELETVSLRHFRM